MIINEEEYSRRVDELSEQRLSPTNEYFDEMYTVAAKCKEHEYLETALRAYGFLGLSYTITNKRTEAEECYTEVETILNKSSAPNIVAKANLMLGTFYWNFCEFEKSVSYFKVALSNFKLLKDEYNTIIVTQNLGIAYFKISDYKKAYTHLHEAYINIDKIDNTRIKGTICSWFGILHNEIGLYEKSFDLMLKSDDYFLESKYYYGYASNQNTIGLVYYNLADSEKAIACFLQAEKYGRELKVAQLTADALSNLAMTYNRLANYSKAIAYAKESIEIRKECGPIDKLHSTYSVLVGIYIHSMDYPATEEALSTLYEITLQIDNSRSYYLYYHNYADYCVTSNNLEDAYDYICKSISIAEDIDNPAYRHDSYILMKSYYSAMGDYQKALKYSEKASSIFTEISGFTTKQKINNLNYQFEIMLLKNNYENKIHQEKTNAALAMAVTANHQLNQPLMIIQGNLEMFVNTFDEQQLNESQKRYLAKINDGLDRIKDILERFRTNTEITFTDYANDNEMVEF